MILREVGKDRRFKESVSQSVLAQPLRGDLHYNVFAACVSHLCKKLEKFVRLGGGSLCVDGRIADFVAAGAYQAAFMSQSC